LIIKDNDKKDVAYNKSEQFKKIIEHVRRKLNAGVYKLSEVHRRSGVSYRTIQGMRESGHDSKISSFRRVLKALEEMDQE